MKYKLIALCLFGLEGILAGEIKRMGGEDVVTTNGRVEFSGDDHILCRANLCLRTAERVLIKLGEFEARTFTELFDNVRALPFEQFIGKQDAFPVKGYSLHSTLYSVPDCQKIIKKAAVERLHEKYGLAWFEETGPVHQIRFSILKDVVTVMLDTSGDPLHKRGYRIKSNDAPIKETLASGMIDVAIVKHDTEFYDPCCGSGTLLIEAAMKAMNIPSGINRAFAAQKWGCIPESVWREERTRGLDLIRRDAAFVAYGGDIDPKAVDLTLENARRAGISRHIHVRVRDVADFLPSDNPAVLVTNPPYGERLMDQQSAREIVSTMGKVFTRSKTRYLIISPDEEFERCFGRRADKRRKLYNGMLKCQLYVYDSIRPKR